MRFSLLLIASVRRSCGGTVRFGWTSCCPRRGTGALIRISCWSRYHGSRFRLIHACGSGFNRLGTSTRSASGGSIGARCGSDRLRAFLPAGLRLTRILIIFFRLGRLGKGFLGHVAFFAGGSANLHVALLPANNFYRLAALQFQCYVKTVQRVIYPNAIFVRAALYRCRCCSPSRECTSQAHQDEHWSKKSPQSSSRTALFTSDSVGLPVSRLLFAVHQMSDCVHRGVHQLSAMPRREHLAKGMVTHVESK